MKIIIFLVILSLASCQFLSFLKQETPLPEPPRCDGGKEGITEFFEGFFDFYDLEKPDQLIACFNDDEANLYFKLLRTINKLVVDSADRKSIATHIDSLKLNLIRKAFRPTWGCMMMTQDWTDLLDALDIKERNPDAFAFWINIYYQANYPTLPADFQPLIDGLDNQNYTQAGEALACIMNQTVQDLRSDGAALQMFSAFSNGAASELDLAFPDDSLDCHNAESAEILLKFLYELSQKVSQGSMKEASLNTFNFWNERGKDLLDGLDGDVVSCYIGSADIDALNKRLKIRVWSPAFKELVKRYINNRRTSFYAYMHGLNCAFDDLNFVHAGYIWGHFLDSLSKYLPYSSVEIES